MQRIGEHAVVIGASMAGLLAARVLADAYERVTVIERDRLPAGVEPRRGVPQGAHAHTLLPRGQACLEELLPGLVAELKAAGAPTYAAMSEMRVVLGGHPLARPELGVESLIPSRPLLEGQVRARVRALANVELRDRCDALGLAAGPDGRRIAGVHVLGLADSSAAETLQSDLVVCATGRGGRVPAWLEALGHPRPIVQRVAVDVRYATRHLRLPAGALDGDRLVLVGPRPELPRTLFLFVQEDGRWIATLGGYGPANRPPSDPDGWLAFAATVAPPEVAEAMRAAEPLDEVATHSFPASVRRRYERVPAGLLVCGDALCVFNPIYGQGMTVAAAEAIALRDCLAHGERDLARRFFAAARPAVDHAWRLATGADLALPDVPGRRPLGVRVINAYLRRLRTVAEHDAAVAGAFIAVVGMRQPPAHVLRPATALRVLRGPRPTGRHLPVAAVRHSELRVGEITTPLRESGPAGADEAVVFVHGNPGSSADWEPLIAAIGARRRAVAWDAPGFGHARAPAGFAQTVDAHAAFIGDALRALGIERAHLVLHDFGGAWGLRWAAGDPARFASTVLLGTGVTPGYRWHAIARAWRTPLLGELLMAATTRAGFRLLLRRGNPRGLPRAFVDRMYDDFDRHTRRAVLSLYRSLADVATAGETLAAALRPLDRPALVLWGRHDAYLPATLAPRQRDAFPHAEVHVLERSGHWPFIDDPATVTAALTGFLATHAGAPPGRLPDRAAPLGAALRHHGRNAARALAIAAHELAEPEAPIHTPALADPTSPPPSAR